MAGHAHRWASNLQRTGKCDGKVEQKDSRSCAIHNATCLLVVARLAECGVVLVDAPPCSKKRTDPRCGARVSRCGVVLCKRPSLMAPQGYLVATSSSIFMAAAALARASPLLVIAATPECLLSVLGLLEE